MRVGVVIPTIGESEYLGRVLEMLARQTTLPSRVVVVDQSDDGAVEAVIQGYLKRLDVTRLVGGRGTSQAKNMGLAAQAGMDIVVFLDDDCLLRPPFLESLISTFEDSGADVLCGVVTTNGRQRVRFSETRQEVNRHNVWSLTMEAATFYRMAVLNKVGAFDETLGTGGPTHWQSGEGTDLVLRAMAAGAVVLFEPSLVVDEAQGQITPQAYATKAKRYARGTGRVYRQHYSLAACMWVVAKPVFLAFADVIRLDWQGWRLMSSVAIGRLEGVMGRCLSEPGA